MNQDIGNLMRPHVLMVDLSGRVLEYDERVWNAWKAELGKDFVFAASMGGETWGEGDVWRLWEFPGLRRWKRHGGMWKRLCKAVEGLVNYAKIWWRLGREKYDIVHLQWLPFTEFGNVEIALLPLLKRRAKKAKWVLTQHNVYPHVCRDRKAYRRRMARLAPCFDTIVLHNESAKRDFCHEFGVAPEKVHSIPFGCYWEGMVPAKPMRVGKLKILHFGGLGAYKGSDLLVQAYASLNEDDWSNSELRVVGKASDSYAEKLRELAGKAPVRFHFGFVPRETLQRELETADLVVLPYREIGQSAVLLLALQFDADLLVSDLGAFLDTMTGAPEDCFFKAGDISALAAGLHRKILRGRGNWLSTQHAAWRNTYRWDAMARATVDLYKHLLESNPHLTTPAKESP